MATDWAAGVKKHVPIERFPVSKYVREYGQHCKGSQREPAGSRPTSHHPAVYGDFVRR
jgi:hypothetical protein